MPGKDKPKARTTEWYRLGTVCGWRTLTARNSDGTTVASIVLPSRKLGRDSVGLADVHRVTGAIGSVVPPAPAFVRAFTIQEAFRPDWRNAAEFNAARIGSMMTGAAAVFSLRDSLRAWASCADADAVRFLMGGDLCDEGLGVLMCEAAKSVPDRLCFAVSANQDVLDSLWTKRQAGTIDIPGNMVFLSESPVIRQSSVHGFPVAEFSFTEGQCELSGYPGDDGMTVRVPEEGRNLMDRPYDTNWIDKLRDLAARQRKEQTT